MSSAVLAIWALAAVLTVAVYLHQGTNGLRRGAIAAVTTARGVALRLPLALLTASFLAESLPLAWLSTVFGQESGLVGIVLASLVGGLLPGGPMTSFPIAVVIFQGGAGTPQLVAFITGWSVFAMHRVIAYEAPIMGWGFVALRMLACAVLPVLCGISAAAILTPLQ